MQAVVAFSCGGQKTAIDAVHHSFNRAPFLQATRLTGRQQSRASKIVASAEDPTGSAPLQLINKFSVAVTNFSPANAVKKAIANLQAGQYDEAAVMAKVDKYIEDNKVRLGR